MESTGTVAALPDVEAQALRRVDELLDRLPDDARRVRLRVLRRAGLSKPLCMLHLGRPRKSRFDISPLRDPASRVLVAEDLARAEAGLNLFYVADELPKRGWTRAFAARLLGDPYAVLYSQSGASGTEVFRAADVEAVEETAAWPEALHTSRMEAEVVVAALQNPPTLPSSMTTPSEEGRYPLTPSELTACARASFSRRGWKLEVPPLHAEPELDRSQRSALLTHLRHEHTEYDFLRAHIKALAEPSRVRSNLVARLRTHVNSVAVASYPQLFGGLPPE